jgi:tetratricopeptide (TPR) repeat protein
MKKLPLIVFAIFLTSLTAWAQTELKKPEASQAAKVSQRIGLTDIEISYHSPLTKGRTVWGDLVPYGKVWRAGANENTSISFSTDVKVGGKNLLAGTYGLHMIPEKDTWTIIFSKNYYSWGSFFYTEAEDALRIKVTPQTCEMQDWLGYYFSNPTASSVTFELRWEKLRVPVLVEVDVPETVFQSMQKELVHINGFFWQGYNQAAAYCVSNNIHLDIAEKWLEKSISIQKNFTNLTTKSKLKALQNNSTESEKLAKEAMDLADETQLNSYGYQLLAQNKNAEAINIFSLNVKRYPASWNVYDSLAEAFEISGNTKLAVSNYKKALEKAPEAQRERIRTTLKKLE